MADSDYFYRPYNSEFKRTVTLYSDKEYTLAELYPEAGALLISQLSGARLGVELSSQYIIFTTYAPNIADQGTIARGVIKGDFNFDGKELVGGKISSVIRVSSSALVSGKIYSTPKDVVFSEPGSFQNFIDEDRPGIEITAIGEFSRFFPEGWSNQPFGGNFVSPNSASGDAISTDLPSPSSDPAPSSPTPIPIQAPQTSTDPVTGINEVNLATTEGTANGSEGITDRFILSRSGTASPARISSFNAAEDFIIAPRDAINNLGSISLKVIRQVLSPEGPVSKAESKAVKKELKAQQKDLKNLAKGKNTDPLAYNQLTGELFFDANGKKIGFGDGGGLLAILEGSPEFSSSNLQILS